MATPLGNTFSTDEKAVVQAELKLLGSIVELLVVEFNQEKFEHLFSSGFVSSKSTQRYRKVSSALKSLRKLLKEKLL